MERFNDLGRGAQIMLVSGVLLFISLFLPWQDFGGDFADELGIDATFSGWRGIGAIVGILTIVLIAWLIVRLASVNIPLPVSTAMSAALIGTLILIFAIIKILTILGDEPTIWAWIGLILAVVVAVGAFQTVQEAGGIDQLRTEVPGMAAPGAGTTTAAAPPPPPPPARTEPPAQEAAPEYTPPAEPEAPSETDEPPRSTA
jgi:hypothetical protein